MRLTELCVVALGLLAVARPSAAQDADPPTEAEKPAAEEPAAAPPHEPYRGTLHQLVGRHEHVTLRSIGKSHGNRPLEVVTILPLAEGRVVPLEETTWGALVVAHLAGDRDVDETRLALDIAAALATAERAPGTAFHVLVDANPDASAAAESGAVRAGNDRPVDDDDDGEADEDGPDDLDRDGRISWMRFPDTTGQLSDTATGDAAAEPRAPVLADPENGKPRTHRLVREGQNGDDDETWNEDGEGGVDLSRNFTVAFEEHVREAGPWPISEPESRAIMDFLLADERIALVYELGGAENAAAAPKPNAAWVKLPDADVRLMSGLREMHDGGPIEKRKAVAPGNGALGPTVVHQLGRIWVGRAPLGRSGPTWPAPDAKWPEHLVVTWRPVTGTGVPEGAELADIALAKGKTAPDVATETPSIAAFLRACARERARVAFVDTKTHEIEGVLGIRTRLVNEGRLPTHTASGAKVKGRRPLNVRLRFPPDAHLLAGDPLVQIERLGPGERSKELKFVVRGASGTRVTLEVTGPDVGIVTTEHTIP